MIGGEDRNPFRGVEQPRNRGVDMLPIVGDLVGRGPRDQAALRPGMAWPGGDVIGIVQKAEAFVEIGRRATAEQELLEEPGHMRTMPFGRAGVGHRLDDLVLGGQHCRAPLGLRAHREMPCASHPGRRSAARPNRRRHRTRTTVEAAGCGIHGSARGGIKDKIAKAGDNRSPAAIVPCEIRLNCEISVAVRTRK